MSLLTYRTDYTVRIQAYKRGNIFWTDTLNMSKYSRQQSKAHQISLIIVPFCSVRTKQNESLTEINGRAQTLKMALRMFSEIFSRLLGTVNLILNQTSTH